MAGHPLDDTDPAVDEARPPGSSEGDEAGQEPVARGKGPRQVRPGDTLGRYELGDELGEGGMATVFRARDRDLRRDVAVKVLFPHLARRAEVVRRFHREARAAAGLEHANILRIYDVGGAEGDDPPYIVMELIRGRTLLQEIEQRGAMLAEIAACIGALLADALSAAHAAGVIHRDVKPANVLIAPGGRLLLADFGVARLETEDSLVTRTGALLGTPAYMSPEQASGDTATARSDLYSLGATLYQLATGSLPFTGSPAKVMTMIATGGLVSPVRRRPACGPELSRLIERLMAPEPGARPGGAAEIAAELRALAASGGLGDASEELAAYFADPEGFLRTRTPTVVSSLAAAARAALASQRLPRAMALVDRASALAPGDPDVVALVHTVTAGGQASRRNRRLAFAGLAVVAAAGAAALALRLAGSSSTAEVSVGDPGAAGAGHVTPADTATRVATRASDDPAADAAAPRAGEARVAAGSSGDATQAVRAPVAARASESRAAADSSHGATGPGAADRVATNVRGDTSRAAVPAAPRATAESSYAATGSGAVGRVAVPADPRRAPSALGDAPRGTAHEPGAVGRDAGAGSLAPAAPSDARVSDEPAGGATPEPASSLAQVVVHNDLWCSIWIDGVERGNRRNERLEVTPGHHVVRCVNPAGEWTQETDVGPGATRILTGSVRHELSITLAVDATIDGTAYARGTVVRRMPGSVEVIAGAKRRFITFRDSCTLRDVPELGCYL